MFHSIKVKFNKCLSISQGSTLFEITKVFKNIVIYYADLLGNKYPRMDKAVKLAENEEVKIALIINTAEYCRHTLGEMEDTIKNSIDLDYVD